MLMVRKGAISAAVAAAIALTTVSFTPASASPRGDAAMLGAVAGVFGMIATIAATNAARDRYYDYDRPVYAAPPVYATPGFGPVYRGQGGWHRHWHR